MSPEPRANLVNRPLVPAGPRGLAEDTHVFLEGGNEVGHDLDGNRDLRAHGGTDDVRGLRLLDIIVGAEFSPELQKLNRAFN